MALTASRSSMISVTSWMTATTAVRFSPSWTKKVLTKYFFGAPSSS